MRQFKTIASDKYNHYRRKCPDNRILFFNMHKFLKLTDLHFHQLKNTGLPFSGL